MQNNCINVRNLNHLEFEVYFDHVQTYVCKLIKPNREKVFELTLLNLIGVDRISSLIKID